MKKDKTINSNLTFKGFTKDFSKVVCKYSTDNEEWLNRLTMYELGLVSIYVNMEEYTRDFEESKERSLIYLTMKNRDEVIKLLLSIENILEGAYTNYVSYENETKKTKLENYRFVTYLLYGGVVILSLIMFLFNISIAYYDLFTDNVNTETFYNSAYYLGSYLFCVLILKTELKEEGKIL